MKAPAASKGLTIKTIVLCIIMTCLFVGCAVKQSQITVSPPAAPTAASTYRSYVVVRPVGKLTSLTVPVDEMRGALAFDTPIASKRDSRRRFMHRIHPISATAFVEEFDADLDGSVDLVVGNLGDDGIWLLQNEVGGLLAECMANKDCPWFAEDDAGVAGSGHKPPVVHSPIEDAMKPKCSIGSGLGRVSSGRRAGEVDRAIALHYAQGMREDIAAVARQRRNDPGFQRQADQARDAVKKLERTAQDPNASTEELNAATGNALHEVDDVVNYGTSQPGFGDDGTRGGGPREDPRCTGLRIAAAWGTMWREKEFCRGDSMMECLRRAVDPIYDLTGGRCRTVPGKQGGHTIHCTPESETPFVPSSEEAIMQKLRDEYCKNLPGPTDVRSPRSCGRVVGEPISLLNTTPAAAVVGKLCQLDDCTGTPFWQPAQR